MCRKYLIVGYNGPVLITLNYSICSIVSLYNLITYLVCKIHVCKVTSIVNYDVTYFLLTLNKYKKRSLWFLRRPVFDFLINIETQEEEEEEEE